MTDTHRTRHGNIISVAEGPSTRVRAQLDDMRTAAHTLDQICSSLDALRGVVGGIGMHLPPMGHLLSPGTALRCEEHVTSLTWGNHRLAEPAQKADTFATLLRTSVEAYERAEESADHRMQAQQTVTALGHLIAGLGRFFSHQISDPSADPKKTLTDTLDAVPDMARGTTALFDAFPTPFGSYAGLLGALGALGQHEAGKAGPVKVTEKDRPGPGTARKATSVADSAKRINELHDADKNAARIQVQRTVDAQAHGRWVVLIHGTQDFGFNRSTPADGTGNLQSINGQASALTGAVIAALEKAQKSEKVYGKHEPVMLVGHSQGGMVAANIGRDAKLRRQFSITRIVTFGAPVGRFEPATRQLDVRNARDPIVKAEGPESGERDPGRTRVTIDDPTSMTNSNGKRDIFAAHDAKEYGNDYEDALESAPRDSAARRFDAESRDFFRGATHTYTYDAHRDIPHEPPPRSGAAHRPDPKAFERAVTNSGISEKLLHGPAWR